MWRFGIVCVSVLLFAGGAAEARFNDIGSAAAQSLVDSALTQHRQHPALQAFNGNDPRFYYFEQTGAGAHVMSFAVNRISGDVWSIEGGCGHVFPSVSHRQLQYLRPPRNILPAECNGVMR